MGTEVHPPSTAADTAWTKVCPHCGAKVQPVARGCWHCGGELMEPDSEHPDYKPTSADEVHAVSVTILAALAVAIPVMFFAWLLSLFN